MYLINEELVLFSIGGDSLVLPTDEKGQIGGASSVLPTDEK